MQPVGGGRRPGDRREQLAAALRHRVETSQSTLPLSAGQRALWLMHQLAPASPAFNIAFAARVVSELDVSAMQRAVQALVDRHAVLRASFPSEDGRPVQRIAPELDIPIQRTDASGWSPARALEAIRAEIDRPFELARGPVIRVRLLEGAGADALLAVTIHHIAMDGWSLWICLRDLRDLYEAAVRGEAAALPGLTADFKTYLRLSAEETQGAAAAAHERYWRARLAGANPVLDLPTDKVRPQTPRYRGAAHTFRIGREATARLRELTRTARGTLQMGVLALFELLLQRYTGQTDFCIGYLAAGRSRSELDEVVGYTANPVTLRAVFRPEATFRDVLRDTRDQLLDALDHQSYPFSMVVDQFAPERDPSRMPLVQALFVFERPQLLDDQPLAAFVLGEPGARMSLGGLTLESLPLSAQREGQFDLTLVVAEMGDELGVSIDYSTDLFEASTISRMAAHLQRLADSATREPDLAVRRLPLLTTTERSLVEHVNATATTVPDLCFHQLFETHASRNPGACAAEFEGGQLSYGDLNSRANRLAGVLRDAGVVPDTVVALCVERSLDLPVAVLGILKAGGAFLPIDPAYPPDRIAYMMADSGAAMLVTQRSLAATPLPFEGSIVLLDELPAGDSAHGGTDVVTPENLAYMIYTSGSTGRPKGVMLEHRGLVNVALEQQRLFGVGPHSRVLQFASLSFDAAVFELAMAYGAGGALCLARSEALLPGQPLLATLHRTRVSIVTLPPSALLQVPFEDVPTLAVITVAGEACPGALVARWAPGRRFFNLYGPTETTIWATAAECHDATPPTIGRPISNTRVHVLDEHLQPQPVGVPGELHIEGIGVARGYHRRSELTSERFIRAPLGALGSRLYKTGDRVRLLATGEIEYLGRLDSQVKVRGFRIELGEVETVAAQHPDILQAVAVVRDDAPGDRRLVAYLIPTPGAQVSTQSVKTFLRTRLPEFMVPSALVFLESLPVTPGGKIDRGALPFPKAAESESAHVAPAGEMEERIAAVWKEVLRLDRVGAEQNFFDCGGTSLLIARVHARVAELAPAAGLSVVEMFQFPTVRSLAARMSQEAENSLIHGSVTRKEALASGQSRLKDLAQRRGRRDQPRHTV